MVHANFNENRSACSGEEDFFSVFTTYGRGGHLGHVTRISRSNFRSPYPWMLHIKRIMTISCKICLVFESPKLRFKAISTTLQ